MKYQDKKLSWEKTPVKVSHVPQHLTNKMFAEGIKKLAGGKSYIPAAVARILKNAGFGAHLQRGRQGAKITKKKFLQAVATLEEAGIIKNGSGKALSIYNKAAAWESWEKTRERNVERRKEEYIREARERADTRAREREQIHGGASRSVSSTTDDIRTEALSSSAGILKRKRELESSEEKRDYLKELRSKSENGTGKDTAGWIPQKDGGWTKK